MQKNANSIPTLSSSPLPIYTIFIGNPGVGKSTISNGIAQKVLFKNGISFGQGLTENLQLEQISPGRWIGDTPGLADDVLRKKAALEIEKALKQNGRYQIIFVINLKAGRVEADDATTIKLVLAALPQHIPFGIILNKLPESTFTKLKDPNNLRKVFASLFFDSRPTTYALCLKEDKNITDKDDTFPDKTLLGDLFKFIEKDLPYYTVMANDVGTIDTANYKEAFQNAQKQLTELRDNIKKQEEVMEKKMKELNEEVRNAQENLRRESERNQQELTRLAQEALNQEKMSQEQFERNQRAQEELRQQNQNLQNQIQNLQQAPSGSGGGCIIV